MTVDRELPRRHGRRVDILLDLWVGVPVVLLAWPLLRPGGYPFSRDLVFTPRLPLRPEALGLGTGAPRAAPLDAVVAVLSTVVDGAVIGRIAVLGVLFIAGWGAHRTVRDLGVTARATAGALAVWNPFVVERLGLGQWALLAGYAALFPLVAALTGARSGGRDRRARWAPWLLLGSLTPTGALLVGATAVVLGVRRRGTDVGLLALALAVQLPWVLPALLGSARAVSDPSAVATFSARAERSGPAMLSLVGLGGIWDAQSVPGSREGWLGHLMTVLVVVALVVAFRRRPRPRSLVPALWWLGAFSFVVASATTIGPVAEAAATLTGTVPGMGLLRDAQKWLAPFAVLAVLAVAALVELALDATRRRAPVLAHTAVALALVLPFALLPDGGVVVNRVLSPVNYPTDFSEVASEVGQEPDATQGALVSAPWRLYRAYPWATPYATYDPSSRWFDVRVLTSDAIAVGDQVLGGEDPWAVRVGAVVTDPGPWTVQALGLEGVRWLLVHREDPQAPAILEAVTADPSARVVVNGPNLVLLRLSGTDVAAARQVSPSPWSVVLVATVDIVVLVLLLLVSSSAGLPWRRGSSATLA